MRKGEEILEKLEYAEKLRAARARRLSEMAEKQAKAGIDLIGRENTLSRQQERG